MATFNKIKFLTSLPSTNTVDTEISAVPFSIPNKYAPNFSSKVTLTLGTQYTVGSGALASYTQGYLFAGCKSRSDDSNAGITFNGTYNLVMGCDTDYGWDLAGYCVFIPCKTGDYFIVPSSGGSPVAYFVPTKG